jgi:hypothetical protein
MIYQLKYTDKEAAQTHLREAVVLDVENEYTSITHAVVYIGAIVDVAGTYDEEGNELTPPTFVDGYHVDVMTKVDVDFGAYVVSPSNPRHKFGGE